MCHEWRKLSAFILTTVLWLAAPSRVRADSSQAKLVARLRQKIEAEQSHVRQLQQLLIKAKTDMYTFPDRASPRNPAPPVQITNIETWWDSDGRLGLTPTFRFRLHNVGSKPIPTLYLSCTYYLASGSKFGSSSDRLVPNVVPIIAPGQWMTVMFSSSRYTGESVSIPFTVKAEIVLSSDESTHDVVRLITIPPKPHRLPVEASLR
jgi:hypothetical protein